MKVSYSEVVAKFKKVLATTGASDQDVERMTRLCLEHDLRDNFFSGIDELQVGYDELKKSVGKQHAIVVDKPALKMVDCNGRSAGLVTFDMLPTLYDMAREQGIAIIGFQGGGYQSMPEVFAREIAAQDLIGILSANGGPQAVTPYGGNRALTGTNPLAYAIPTMDMPIVFDAATSEHAWGSIRRAKERGQQLPDRHFIDKDGNWTTDPGQATGIIPFGEHRGFAVNLLLEVLTGPLVRAKCGMLVKDEDDLGGFLIAIDPAAFGSLDEFKQQTTRLAKDIEETKPAEGFSEVHTPGYNSERRKQKHLAEDTIEVEEPIWQRFQERCQKLTGK